MDNVHVKEGEAPPKHERCRWPDCPEHEEMERIATRSGFVQYICTHTGRLVVLEVSKIDRG